MTTIFNAKHSNFLELSLYVYGLILYPPWNESKVRGRLVGNVHSLLPLSIENLETPLHARSDDFCIVAQMVLSYYDDQTILQMVDQPQLSTFTSSLSDYQFHAQDNGEFNLVFPIKYTDLVPGIKILLSLYHLHSINNPHCIAIHLFDLFTPKKNLIYDNDQLDFGRFRLELNNISHLNFNDFNSTNSTNSTNSIPFTSIIQQVINIYQYLSPISNHRFRIIPGKDQSIINHINHPQSIYLDVTLKKPPSHWISTSINPPSLIQPTTLTRSNWDLIWSNPTEIKHSKLSQRQHDDLIDYDRKPSVEDLVILNRICKPLSISELIHDERQLIWKYRTTIIKWPYTLIKFAQSVDWSQPSHANHALELMMIEQSSYNYKLPSSNISTSTTNLAQLLELLSWRNPTLRHFVVTQCLEKLGDTEIEIYLLQLIQGLRYSTTSDCPLFSLLIRRSLKNQLIANFVYWYLHVEKEGDASNIFSKRSKEFLLSLKQTNEGRKMVQLFTRQQTMTDAISQIAKEERSISNKQDQLTLANQRIHDYGLLGFEEPLPLPLDPDIMVRGIGPTVQIFSSANSPIRLDFHINHDKYYPVIFKEGDDLRQDQLAIQLLRLVDLLLVRENLSLNFIPYKILPTSRTAGLIEFIPNAHSVAEIEKSREGPTILDFLKKNNPDPTTKTGICSKSIDLYITSCAGYCVVNHVFGWTDRHMNNILITEQGNLFHIDFGWIFGKYPSRLLRESSLRLTQNMLGPIEKAEQFDRFLALVKEAFLLLRQNSRLLISLISLMLDSKLKDLSSKQDLQFIEEKLGLNMTEEEATNMIEVEIRLAPQSIRDYVKETLHRWVTKD